MMIDVMKLVDDPLNIIILVISSICRYIILRVK